MKLHELKIKEKFFYDVRDGYKKAELRKDDRDYKVGDLIHFVDIHEKEFDVFEDNLYVITHILSNAKEYGLQDGYVILSIEKVR